MKHDSTATFPTNPSYQAVVRSLLRMHQSTVDGKDESEEADVWRESMNEPWEALSKTERERVTGLSKDLYEISDPADRNSEPMNPQAQRKLNVYEARERGEWDRALDLLRGWGKSIAAPLVSCLRGFIWRAAGDADTAAVFFEHASRRELDNEKFQAVLLDILKTANPTETSVRAEAILPADFERAIELSSPWVWPYLLLAHHFLTNNRFDDCWSVCERAPRKPASRRAESEHCEFLATSGLGYPERIVRRAFENAVRVDPSNERARRNLQLFENAVAAHAPHPKSWERRSESLLRTFADEENAWPREAFSSWHTMAGV